MRTLDDICKYLQHFGPWAADKNKIQHPTSNSNNKSKNLSPKCCKCQANMSTFSMLIVQATRETWHNEKETMKTNANKDKIRIQHQTAKAWKKNNTNKENMFLFMFLGFWEGAKCNPLLLLPVNLQFYPRVCTYHQITNIYIFFFFLERNSSVNTRLNYWLPQIACKWEMQDPK